MLAAERSYRDQAGVAGVEQIAPGGGHLVAELGHHSRAGTQLARGADLVIGVLSEKDALVVLADAQHVRLVVLLDVLGVCLEELRV